jgi:G3E family GTPase
LNQFNIEHADPIMPRRYSDLVQFTEHLSRQLVGTRHALASDRGVRWNLDRLNTMMQRQVQRADAVVVNNTVLREEIVELKKQIVEEKRIADVLRRSGGDTRNKLENDVVQLTMDKAYLEGELQEALSGGDERYARLEALALEMLETLG